MRCESPPENTEENFLKKIPGAGVFTGPQQTSTWESILSQNKSYEG